MDAATSQPRLYRFGPFELDARTGELRRGGTRIRIGGHAFQILLMLIERQGEAVLRDEIQLRLWPGGRTAAVPASDGEDFSRLGADATYPSRDILPNRNSLI